MDLKRLRNPVIALITGAIGTLGFAPFELWWCALISLAGWMWCTRQAPGFTIGFVYGLGLFVTGVSWVSVSMIDHGGASIVLASLMTGCFAAGLAIFPGLASLGFAMWRRRWPTPLREVMLLTALWVTIEAFRSWFLTGFPWLLMGYVALDSPFEGYLSWIGTYGVSALLAVTAGLCVASAVTRQLQWLLVPLLLVSGGLFLNSRFTPELEGSPVEVALWQPVIEQSKKWKPEHRASWIDLHLNAGLPSDASLVIWPETALPMIEDTARDALGPLDDDLRARGATLISGVLGQHNGRYTNRLMTLGAGTGTYDKTRLVPFGEYVPLESVLRGLIAFFDLPMSAIVPGVVQETLTHGELKMAPLICYEIAYAGIARQHSQNANAILTVSNDTWFGDSIGPDQHQEIAQIRARELAKPVIRATNDGLSTLINAHGDITHQLPRFERSVLIGEVTPSKTVTAYSRAGEAPVIILLVILLTLSRRNEAVMPSV